MLERISFIAIIRSCSRTPMLHPLDHGASTTNQIVVVKTTICLTHIHTKAGDFRSNFAGVSDNDIRQTYVDLPGQYVLGCSGYSGAKETCKWRSWQTRFCL